MGYEELETKWLAKDNPRYALYPKFDEPPLTNGEWFVLDHGDGMPDKADTKVFARCSNPQAARRIAVLLNEAEGAKS